MQSLFLTVVCRCGRVSASRAISRNQTNIVAHPLWARKKRNRNVVSGVIALACIEAQKRKRNYKFTGSAHARIELGIEYWFTLRFPIPTLKEGSREDGSNQNTKKHWRDIYLCMIGKKLWPPFFVYMYEAKKCEEEQKRQMYWSVLV